MVKYFVPVLFVIIFFSCSSNKELVKEDKTYTAKLVNPAEKGRYALDHFINGSVAEAKGDYAGAISEYLESLSLDTSAAIYYALAKNYYVLDKTPQALNCRSEEHTSELQSLRHLVCRLLLEKKNRNTI